MTPRILRRIAYAFVVLWFPLHQARAEPVGAPTLCWRGEAGACIAAAALALDVDYRVSGLIAEASVKQRFRNDGSTFLEGTYLLPLPDGAAVHTLKLRIGARVIEGEIRERAQARAEYQAAAAAGQRTGLVEQHQANLFRTAVANVAPGEEISVEVGFWQRVEFRDGRFNLAFPLTVVPRYALGATATDPAPSVATARGAGTHAGASIAVALEPGLPVQAIESSTHAIDVQRAGSGYEIVVVDTRIPADRDFVLHWRPQPGARPDAALFVEHAADGDYAMLMMLAAEQPAERLPRELILVVDTSGSMYGGAIEQAKAALDAALARLAPSDRFNVIQFNSITEALLEQPVAATPDAVKLAREWVATLAADGGTEMHPALERAFAGAAPAGYVRQVVFATDGAVTGEEALYRLIESGAGGARLFPVGIGDAPNAHFLAQAARLGRGANVVIRNLSEVAERMDELYAKLDRPALRDVQLAWPGGAVESFPSRIPDLYQGEPLLVVARLAQAKGQVDAVGWLKDAAWSKSLPLARTRSDAGVARLWARAKIDDFEDQLRRGADEAVVRPQLIEVALAHHLVTRFTSLIAVDKTPVRPADAALSGADIVPEGSDDRLAYAQGATPAPLLALSGALGLLLVLLAGAPRRRARVTARTITGTEAR
jgi:Ca-activated chloride channel family protein